jgi:hypothetical protein
MKKFSKLAAVCLTICVVGLSACNQTTDQTPDTTTTAANTTAITTTLAETAANTNAAETTVSPDETTATTPAETTTVPETEATTTASITTADNSSDTRTTQQKLDDLIAANPDVEIGYALVKAPKTRESDVEAVLTHNLNMSLDMSDEIMPYAVFWPLFDGNYLSDEFLYMQRYHVDSPDNNSEVYKKYEEGVKSFYSLAELISMYVNNDDMDVDNWMKLALLPNENLNRGSDVLGQRIDVKYENVFKRVTSSELVWQWKELYRYTFIDGYADEDKFMRNLLTTTNEAYFYDGTGNVAMHLGDSNDNGECYDSGIFNVNGEVYIFVIYTKNSATEARTDLVSEISRILYDDVSK